MGTSASLYNHRGNFFRPVSPVAGKDAVVLAGVKGGDVAVVMLVSEVVFCRLAFTWPCRDLEKTAFAAVRAVLPHGYSTGEMIKEESHCGIKRYYNDIKQSFH